jgi:opacity protein-like surface antigen
MKKVIMALVMVVSFAFAAKAQEVVTPTPVDPNAPDMQFETEVIDYGTIEYGSNGVREFKFKNVGKQPLVISNAAGSCGCTTPEWPKEPIAAGQSQSIKVKYDTNRVGSFEKTVTITSNAKTPTKVLKIKGIVKPNPNAAPTNTTPAPTPQGNK